MSALFHWSLCIHSKVQYIWSHKDFYNMHMCICEYIILVPFTQRSKSATSKIISLKNGSLKYDKMNHTLKESAHFPAVQGAKSQKSSGKNPIPESIFSWVSIQEQELFFLQYFYAHMNTHVCIEI